MENGVESPGDEWRNAAPTPGRVAFVGVLNYRPNVQGIVWFAQHVWPHVRRQHPRATLTIVGRDPVAAVKGLDRIAGVSVEANVPDVKPSLAAAEVVVAPLAIARGVQNKVLEALAMRRAVVASPAACAGLSAQPGVELCCAASAEDWHEAVGELLADSTRRDRFATAGERYARTHHDWRNCLAPLGDWLEDIAPYLAVTKRHSLLAAEALPHA
jgi:glycosyltransferase involved in cell wall biosynthesis